MKTIYLPIDAKRRIFSFSNVQVHFRIGFDIKKSTNYVYNFSKTFTRQKKKVVLFKVKIFKDVLNSQSSPENAAKKNHDNETSEKFISTNS